MTDRYHLTIVLDGLPPMNSADGFHWRKRQRLRKQWERRVSAEVLASDAGKPPKPLESARVTVTRCSAKQPDADNLAQSGKWILDGLVKAGVLADDAPSVIGQPLYQWEPAKPKHGRVVVTVEERA